MKNRTLLMGMIVCLFCAPTVASASAGGGGSLRHHEESRSTGESFGEHRPSRDSTSNPLTKNETSMCLNEIATKDIAYQCQNERSIASVTHGK